MVKEYEDAKNYWKRVHFVKFHLMQPAVTNNLVFKYTPYVQSVMPMLFY